MAETYVIHAKLRKGTGKSVARKLRREGWVPAVYYGPGEPSTPIAVEEKELSRVLHAVHGRGVVLQLQVDGATKSAIIKEIQREPLYGRVIHVDFQVLKAGEKVEVTVPIVLTGTPEGVKKGGVLEQVLRELDIRVLPDRIPPEIQVDVSGLDLGDSVHVRDLKLEGVEILTPGEETIATVLVPRGLEEEEEKPEEAAPEEGAAPPTPPSEES